MILGKEYNGLCENLCSLFQCSVLPPMRVPTQFQKETGMVQWLSFTSSGSISLPFIAFLKKKKINLSDYCGEGKGYVYFNIFLLEVEGLGLGIAIYVAC